MASLSAGSEYIDRMVRKNLQQQQYLKLDTAILRNVCESRGIVYDGGKDQQVDLAQRLINYDAVPTLRKVRNPPSEAIMAND